MRFCTQCGASLEPGAPSCWQCGFRQPERESSPAQPPQRFPLAPVTLPGPLVSSSGASGIVLSPKILAGIGVVVIIIAAVLFFVLPYISPPAGSSAGSGSAGTGISPSGTGPPGMPDGSSPAGTPAETFRTQVVTTTRGCPQGLVACSGLCRDMMTDEQNCGRCENRCTPYQVCSSGRCTSIPGSSGLDSVATSPPAAVAAVPTTAAPLPTTAGCAAGTSLCNGVCTDILTSNGNCGSCNNRCAEGQKCQGGRCVFSYCLKPLTLCNGFCRNLYSDMSNCGSCGKVCPSPVSHGTVRCENGICKVTCEKDYGNCDGVITNGCESYLRFDANNCGSCGVKCSSGYVCDADTTGCHPRIIK